MTLISIYRLVALDTLHFLKLSSLTYIYCIVFISKTDEGTEADSLGYLLPAHEYFHQSMVVADCDSELFRESSRGLEGGSFFVATILNRKDAKCKRGKDAIDGLTDFILLKADGRFCQYFIKKYNLDPELDNTPDLLRKASFEKKEDFLHQKVVEVLRDLLPFFKPCSYSDPHLEDHPLQEGKRPSREIPRKETIMEQALLIGQEVVDITIGQLQQPFPDPESVGQNMEEKSVILSGSRSRVVFRCKLCGSEFRFRTACLAHVELCLVDQLQASQGEQVESHNLPDASTGSPSREVPEETENELNEETENEINEETENETNEDDMFWNYKSSEFFLDAIFAVTDNFEKFGDGLGCYIVNKVLLPILHGLKHSNYSSSVHRFIVRVLCEATPKEGLKLVHERFSNRNGKPGQNIHRDRRMEYRIGTAKKLIENLGPNFTQEAVQQVNKTLEVKEELFIKTRGSHGVNIRSGRHNPRSDAKDYDMLYSHLTDTRAHVKIPGRAFGDLSFSEDLMEDKRFNKIEFYRWIVTKNKEAKSVLNAKKMS